MKSPLGALAAAVARPSNKAPVPYVSRGVRHMLPFGSRSDAEAQMRAMGSVGTLFAIVNRTSNAVAQVEWKLWRKAKSGKDEDRVEVASHLALDIWRKPNKFYTRQELVETTQQHRDLTGEAWWVIARDPRARAIPLELWPVRPDRMEPVPHPEDFLSGYIYRSPDGERIPLKLDEVIQLRTPNPLDPYRGMGPVQSILTDLDSTRYSAEWNRNFFINSATPGGIIEVPDEWNDEEFDQFRDRWDEQHRGVAAAHRVALLERGAKWVERTYSMRDMQFVELREISSKVIREAFGMPKFAIGDVEDVNRATAEASKAWFAEQLTIPRLEGIKGALNNDYLPLFGATAEGLEFDFEDPVPQDAEARDRERISKATAAKLYREGGWSRDSIREALELPEALEAEPDPEPEPAPALPVPAAPAARGADALLARLRAQADDEDQVERLVEQAMRAIRAAFEAALSALLAAWGRISGRQREQLVDQVREAVEAGDVSALADLTADTEEARDELAAAMVALAAIGAQQVVDEAAAQGVSAEPVEPEEGGLGATAAVVVALLAAGLAGAAAREALRVWVPDAEPGEVARQVEEHLRSLSDRALRDELGGALHAAQQTGRMATLEAAPDPSVWIASERNDDSTCQPCRDVDDQRYRTYAAARAAYPVGGYRECAGRTRCRGCVVPIWEDAE